jgi:phosphatidylinositol 4-kinase
MICWIPALLFTTEALQTGTSAWTWLLASRPDIHIEIMAEICEAWCWTIQQRIGLFSDAERYVLKLYWRSLDCFLLLDQMGFLVTIFTIVREPSPVAIAKSVNPSSKNLKKYTDVPHRLWITFLQERFIVVRESSPEEIDIISKMLQSALTDASSISILPVSMCTRFRLLLLAVRYMQSGAIKDEMLENLLRERVYLAALYWFCHEQTWYDPGDRANLVDDVQLLIDFCKAMVAEEGYQKKRKDEMQATFYDGWNELEDQKPQGRYFIHTAYNLRHLLEP